MLLFMPCICEAGAHHFQALVECQLIVLESLSDSLPKEFIKHKRDRLLGTDFETVHGLQNREQLNLVARENGLIIGFALGKIDRGNNSWLTFLGVLPLFRGRGFGEALLKEFLIKSKLLGARRVCLFTAVELVSALNLYIKFGFSTDNVPRYREYGIKLFKYVKNIE